MNFRKFVDEENFIEVIIDNESYFIKNDIALTRCTNFNADYISKEISVSKNNIICIDDNIDSLSICNIKRQLYINSRIGTIYIITNKVNSKVYIGQTIQNIKNRFEQHKINSTKNNCNKFYNAIRNIGIDKFNIDILEDNIKLKDLNDKERYYINKYNSIENGYNTLMPDNRKITVADIDKYADKIIEDFYNSVAIVDIAIKYNVATITIYRFIERYELKREKCNTKYKGKKGVYCFNEDGTFFKYFESLSSALEYTISIGYSGNRGQFYQNIKHACNIGCIAYNKRWSYSNKLVKNSKYISLDKEKIKNNNNIQKKNKDKTIKAISESNVKARNKCKKPSKNELQRLIDSNVSNIQIAIMYNRSSSTVSYWKKCLKENKYI